ncbi:DUF1311 domain-containing protein [Rossellomorea aquimaris]|uniref:lysozyme inhibitor LprI family protein n=1 Tax=Rossellomorea aquimaris TaxID=189382 RepID=UPI001CD6FCC5|nr:lysozyme inhibitor LprI family protein [Rossellomorea aquimaris]MCA1054400.1 DUF1311 domain-containing protein [Rossellomorea aquimaris]
MIHIKKGLICSTAVLLLAVAGCQDDSTGEQSVDRSSTAVETKDDGDGEEQEAVDETVSSEESKEEEIGEQTESAMKELYLKKLNQEEEDIRRMLDDSDASTTLEMEEEQEKIVARWDRWLNVIYSVLKEGLPPEEFTPLKEEQRKWIKVRDEKAENASKKYEGGTMERLEFLAVKAELTKVRAYALVAKYMK